MVWKIYPSDVELAYSKVCIIACKRDSDINSDTPNFWSDVFKSPQSEQEVLLNI